MQAFVLNVATFNQHKKYNSFQFQKSTLAAWMDDLSVFKGSWFSDDFAFKYGLLTMCYGLLSFFKLLQLQSVPLLTSALLGSQRCGLPHGLASTQPVWQNSALLSPTPHPLASPFTGVSCMNVMWSDQIHQWLSGWSGRQQPCIPWHRVFLQPQLEEPEAFHKVWVQGVQGYCEGIWGGTQGKKLLE